MTTLSLERSASQNLIGTYFRLGAATPRAQLWQEDGFRICTGDFEHPICNFAADLRLTPWSARRLVEIAINRPSFNVYVLPGDEPRHVRELLQSAGFRLGHCLVQMSAEPKYRPTSVSLKEAACPNERARVARFMVEQFFGRQPNLFRRRVADTTCAASELPLYTIEERGRILAAVMLSDEGNVVGMYNLCVSASLRGKGWGSELVHSVLNLAAARGKAVVLQCEPGLQSWYSNLTFSAIGDVAIHSLPKCHALDIMELT